MECTTGGCDRPATTELVRTADAMARPKCQRCAAELIAVWPGDWSYTPADEGLLGVGMESNDRDEPVRRGLVVGKLRRLRDDAFP